MKTLYAAAVLLLVSAASADDEPMYTDAGQKFVRSKFEELEKFKTDPKFIEIGFGTAGPYYPWLKSIQDMHKSKPKEFSRAERIAVGDLLTLGLEYAAKRGKDTDYTKRARDYINKALRPLSPPKK